jgi:hypothetical protein
MQTYNPLELWANEGLTVKARMDSGCAVDPGCIGSDALFDSNGECFAAIK